MSDGVAQSDFYLEIWLDSAANTRNQITKTKYDVAYGPVNGVVLGQKNLRNRVQPV
jgi:hypothetical protein